MHNLLLSPIVGVTRLIGRLLARDRRGMAFLEFAMVMPLILALLVGSVLGGGMMLAYMKVNDAAQMSVDLITQCTKGVSTTASGDLQNFADAAADAIYPLNAADLTIAYASVSWNTSSGIGPSPFPAGATTGTADWVWPTGTTLFTTGAVTQVQNAGIIQNGLAGSVIVVNATYLYTLPINISLPMFGGGTFKPFPTSITLTESGFSVPRYVQQILQETPPSTNSNTNLFCP